MFSLLQFLLLPAVVFCFNYDLVFDNEKFYEPCKDDPDNFITKWINFDDINFAYISDELISINGEMLFQADFQSTDRIALLIEVLKFERGMWVPTVFTIKRDDLCKTAFSPTEIWHDVTKIIPKEQQICPLPNGVWNRLTFRNATVEMRLRWMPDPYMEGEYKLVTKARVVDKDEAGICFEIPFHLYRE